MIKQLTTKELIKLSKVVKNWNTDKDPEYRAFKCGNCLKEITKAWHIWFDDGKVRCEIHLCKECAKQYNLI